jgi:hypothetical protein
LLSSVDVCVDYVFRTHFTRYSAHYMTGSRWESRSEPPYISPSLMSP